jgi:hypothetical protein
VSEPRPSRSATFTADGAAPGELILVCDACGGHICAVEQDDDLDVIVQTALDHADECDA